LQAQGGNFVNVFPQAQQSGRPAGFASLVVVTFERSVFVLKEPAVCFVVGIFVTLNKVVMMVVEFVKAARNERKFASM